MTTETTAAPASPAPCSVCSSPTRAAVCCDCSEYLRGYNDARERRARDSRATELYSIGYRQGLRTNRSYARHGVILRSADRLEVSR